jgi:uncharacterized membrane protein
MVITESVQVDIVPGCGSPYDNPTPRGPRMRVISLGHFLFAFGLAGLGVLSLLSGDFALNWQPVAAWVPGRTGLAYVSGALLLVVGIGMLVKRTAGICSLIMALYMLSWVLVLQAPRVAVAPADVGVWLGFCESLTLTVGGWMIFASLAEPETRQRMKFCTDARGRRVARLLFGACCVVFGLSHFVYARFTASMVPAWLPDRLDIAYLAGAGHLAAGLAILFAVLPRLAATMEAAMISSFVVLLHFPGAVAAPGSRREWTMFFVATALAGAAWSVARTYREQAWG